MNFADKHDIKKLNTRLDLLSKKLEKMSDIVPDNQQILEQTHSDRDLEKVASSTSNQPVQEAWSKLMLTKRIDANEESLEKFMQLLDKLASELENMKDKVLREILIKVLDFWQCEISKMFQLDESTTLFTHGRQFQHHPFQLRQTEIRLEKSRI